MSKLKNASDICWEQFVQISIITLIVIIVSCLVFITGLFFMEHHYRNQMKNTNEHDLIVRPIKFNTIQTRKSFQPKDTGHLPIEIDGFLDKDKYFSCLWLKRLVTNSGSCEYNRIKSKMNKIVERKKDGGTTVDKNTFISFVVKIDRFSDMTYKDMTIGVYGSYGNFTAETNATTGDECGRSELVQQCGGDKSAFSYGFHLPVTKHLTDYFISVSYRHTGKDGPNRGCSTSVSMTMTCPSNPYAGLWAVNGTRWDPSDKSYEWPTDGYSVSEDSGSVTVIVRHKPWPYERLKASCKPPEDKRTLAIVEYGVSLHKSCGEVV